MSSDLGWPQIWVVDRLEHLRVPVVQALHQTGFSVRSYNDYGEILSSESPQPDLVLISCVRPRVDETSLLERLCGKGVRVLIIASSLSSEDMRSFFLSGALDVAERPSSQIDVLSFCKALKEKLPSYVPQAEI